MTVIDRRLFDLVASADTAAVWDAPSDALLSWQLHPRWADRPVTPLEGAVAARGIAQGARAAAQQFGFPVRARAQRINGFLYVTAQPAFASPGEREDQLASALEALGAAGATLGERWVRELRPEVERYLAGWRSFDLRAASLAALIGHFDETLRRLDRVWEILFAVGLPASMLRATFADEYARLFGVDAAEEAASLLEGLEGPELATERAFARLSRAAAASSAVRDALRWRADHEWIEALAGSEAGREFLAELQSFLERHGRRGDRGRLVEAPGWIENPRPVLLRLRERLLAPQPEEEDVGAALDDERCRLLEELSERLTAFGRPVETHLNRLLRAAQRMAQLEQEAELWVLQRCMFEVRQVIVELGRRFADAGALADARDVVFLDLREIRLTAKGLPDVDQRDRVARRKAELRYCSDLRPAAALGEPGDDPVSRVLGLLFAAVPAAPPMSARATGR